MKLSDLDAESGTYFKHDGRFLPNVPKTAHNVGYLNPTRSARLRTRITLDGVTHPVTIDIVLGKDGFELHPRSIKSVGILPQIKTGSGILLENNRVLFGDRVTISYESDKELATITVNVPFIRNGALEIEDAVKPKFHNDNHFIVYFIKTPELFHKLITPELPEHAVALVKFIPDALDGFPEQVAPVLMTVRGRNLRHKAHSVIRLASCDAVADTGFMPEELTVENEYLAAPKDGSSAYIYKHIGGLHLKTMIEHIRSRFSVYLDAVFRNREDN